MYNCYIDKFKLATRSKYILSIRYLIRRLGVKYVREVIYERLLSDEISNYETLIPLDIIIVEKASFFQPNGIPIASEDNKSNKESISRLKKGDVCIIGLSNKKIVGYTWICFQKMKYEPVIEYTSFFHDNEALIYDTFVFPEFRKKKIALKLIESGLRYMYLKGYKKSFVHIQWDNVPSVKSFEALGFHPIKLVIYLRVFTFKKIKQSYI